jgi:hypothetical protein
MEKDDIAPLVHGLSDRHIRSVMGFLNSLLYATAKSLGAVERIGQSIHVVPAALHRLEEPVTVTVPLTYIQNYLERFWGRVVNSLPTLRKIRSLLASLGIFEVEKQEFLGNVPKGDRNGYTRATYLNFDAKLALKLYEILEKIYLERGNKFEDLPPHRGAFVKRLYDAMFQCSVGMNRAAGNFGTAPMTMAQAAEYRSQQLLSVHAADANRVCSLEDTIAHFKHIGLDKKEPGIFGEMKRQLAKVTAIVEKRLKLLPF